jgi:hypothetical protein
MMTQRIFTEPALANLPDLERWVFLALQVVADDYGKGSTNPHLLKGSCFPHQPEFTAEAIAAALVKLSETKDADGLPLILLYGGRASGKASGTPLVDRFFALPWWQADQFIAHPTPSSQPNPPSGRVFIRGTGKNAVEEGRLVNVRALDPNLHLRGTSAKRGSGGPHESMGSDSGGTPPGPSQDEDEDKTKGNSTKDEDEGKVGDSSRLAPHPISVVSSGPVSSSFVSSQSSAAAEPPGASEETSKLSVLSRLVSSPLVPSHLVAGVGRQAGRIETDCYAGDSISSENRRQFVEFLAAVDWNNGSFDALIRLVDSTHEMAKLHGRERARRYVWGSIKPGGKFRTEHGKPGARRSF